jgi:hypothetical protein
MLYKYQMKILFHDVSSDIDFILYVLMIYSKILVKLYIVWIFRKNIGLIHWNGGSTSYFCIVIEVWSMRAIFANYSSWIMKVNSAFKYVFYHTDSNVNT